jgi:hypothetical protein
VYADAIATNPPDIDKPTVDLAHWYANADLGPTSGCNVGAFPGGFDTDGTMNVSRSQVDLTPASAYDCQRWEDSDGDGDTELVAQVKWQPGSPGTLTIQGAIFFDADVSWQNLNLIQYDGRATIYASGQVLIRNRADLCGVPDCGTSWDPRVDLLVLVAGSLVSETVSDPISGEIGNHVNFQGAIYAVNDLNLDNNTTVWGPLITRNASLANSVTLHAPPYAIDEYMLGMPGATQEVVHVDLVPGSYAG